MVHCVETEINAALWAYMWLGNDFIFRIIFNTEHRIPKPPQIVSFALCFIKFFLPEKIGVTLSVAAPGVTHPSDATESYRITRNTAK